MSVTQKTTSFKVGLVEQLMVIFLKQFNAVS